MKQGDKFKCYDCGEEFNSANSDEEAREKSNELFGKDDNRDEVMLCDDCFKKLPNSESTSNARTEISVVS